MSVTVKSCIAAAFGDQNFNALLFPQQDFFIRSKASALTIIHDFGELGEIFNDFLGDDVRVGAVFEALKARPGFTRRL
jgi:hypothetical protein